MTRKCVLGYRDDGDYAKNLYLPSYARFGPYVIGLFTGYVLFRLKCKCRIPKVGK